MSLQEAGEDAEVDVDHVVRQAASVRVAGVVARQHAEAVGRACRRGAEVDLQRVHGRFLRALALNLVQPRNALEDRLDDVRPVVLRGAEVEQHVHHVCQLGRQHVLAVPRRVLVGLGPVELVLLPERDHDLVDQRVAQPTHLHPEVMASAMMGGGRQLEPATLGRGPDAYDRVLGGRAGDGLAVARDLLVGHLQDDRVDVVARQVVLASALVTGAGAGAEVDGVERHPQVDEERVVTLAGEHLSAAPEVPDRGACHRVVVRERLGAGVVRRDREVVGDPLLTDLLPVLVPLAEEVVGLHDVELRIVEARHSGQRVQERVLVPDVRLELELVTDVVLPITRVVDVDVVVGAVVEPVEVRTARRILERDPVRHHRQLPGRVVRRERIDVGVVRGRVECRVRGFAVARADAHRHGDEYRRHGGRQSQGQLPHGCSSRMCDRPAARAEPSSTCDLRGRLARGSGSERGSQVFPSDHERMFVV